MYSCFLLNNLRDFYRHVQMDKGATQQGSSRGDNRGEMATRLASFMATPLYYCECWLGLGVCVCLRGKRVALVLCAQAAAHRYSSPTMPLDAPPLPPQIRGYPTFLQTFIPKTYKEPKCPCFAPNLPKPKKI